MSLLVLLSRGASAVLATIETWFGIANVKRYGAKGDGATLDTTAVQDAITGAAANGGTVYFGTGTYRVESLTVPVGVTLQFANDSKLSLDSGAVLTINGEIKAGPRQIFSGAGTVGFISNKTPFMRPEWWGGPSISDGVTDAYAALQAMLTCLIASSAADGCSVGRLLAGVTYSIGSPLLAVRIVAGAYAFFGMTLESDGTYPFDTTRVTAITPTFSDTFGLGIQMGKGVTIRGIDVKGTNVFTSRQYASMLNDTIFVQGSCRDSRYSPYAGIAIDPFKYSGTPSDGGYPGLSSYYAYSPGSTTTGSTRIQIEDCNIEGFVAGIILSPNGQTQNAENIDITRVNTNGNKSHIAVCQSQSRQVMVRNHSAFSGKYAVDCGTYGARNGTMPKIDGVNVGAMKYIFNGAGSAGVESAEIRALYAEETLALGFWGWSGASYPLKITGGLVTLVDLNALSLKSMDSHLHAGSPVVLDDFSITWSSAASTPIRINNIAAVSLRNSTTPGMVAPDSGSWRGIFYNGHRETISGRTAALLGIRDTYAEVALSQLNREKIGLLATIRTSTQRILANGLMTSFSIATGSTTVTVNADGTATFTAGTPERAKVGDAVFTVSTFWNPETPDFGGGGYANVNYRGMIGTITSIVSTTITLGNVPYGLATGTFSTLSVYRYPLFHQATTGDTTNGSNQITNVSQPTAWAVNDPMQGSGRPAGDYITAIAGSTFTMAQNSTATATGVRLYDLDCQIPTLTAY